MATKHEPTGRSEAKRVRAAKALDLRIAGATFRQIGAQCGVSERTAYYDVQDELAVLETVTGQKAERLRELELERCNKLTLYFWPRVQKGDAHAARVVLAAMDRRAKLLGLDAPTKLAGASGEALAIGRVEFLIVDPPNADT